MSFKESDNAETPPNVGNLSAWRKRIQQCLILQEEVRAQGHLMDPSGGDDMIRQSQRLRSETTLIQHLADLWDEELQSATTPAETEEINARYQASTSEQQARMQAIASNLPADSELDEFNRLNGQLTDRHVAISKRYGMLANDLNDVPPAHYISRALGSPYEPLEGPWAYTRVKIELGRQLLAVTDPSVTLGTPPTEAWERAYYKEITRDVQLVHIGQIMLAANVTGGNLKATAQQFEKTPVIRAIGPPPELSLGIIPSLLDKSVENSWLEEAFSVMQELEPPEHGLLIDDRIS